MTEGTTMPAWNIINSALLCEVWLQYTYYLPILGWSTIFMMRTSLYSCQQAQQSCLRLRKEVRKHYMGGSGHPGQVMCIGNLLTSSMHALYICDSVNSKHIITQISAVTYCPTVL